MKTTIQAKQLYAFSAIIAAMLCMVAFSMWSLHKIGHANTNIRSANSHLECSRSIQAAANDIIAIADKLLLKTALGMDATPLFGKFEAARILLASNEERLHLLMEEEKSKELHDSWEHVQQHKYDFIYLMDGIVKLIRKWKLEEARYLQERIAYRSVEQFLIATEIFIDDHKQIPLGESHKLGRFNRDLQRKLVILSIFVIFIGVVIALYFARSITNPIAILSGLAHEISTGNLDVKSDIKSNDEIGQLAQSFNSMAENLLKRTQELSSSNKELDDFAYTASHDLKEPLRGIHNYSSFLIEDYEDKLDEDGKHKLHTLMKLSSYLEDLISNLLYYSRVGRTREAFAETDLNQIVEEIQETLRIKIEELGTDFRIPVSLPVIYCDRVRITDIFLNLVSNALKYNNSEEKWIEIGFEKKRDLNGYIFHIRDNGIGIREKHIDSIFKIFKRLHGKGKYGGGTGAGLAIVKKIVESHGGSIWVESTFGQGTTFYFTLRAMQ